MCKVKCVVGPGLIESEKVVQIRTAEGHTEEVTVSARQVIEDQTLAAGYIGQSGENVLIELPRESASGRWRLWVPADQVTR